MMEISKMCDTCGIKLARIHLEGRGNFCLNCYNEMFCREHGIENTYDYAETMAVLEPNGEEHVFRIEHLILGQIVTWDAWEQSGNYHFREISDIRLNGHEAAKRFFQKIVEGVCTKTLEEHDPSLSDGVMKDGKLFLLGSKGDIRIQEDDGKIVFEISGRIFSGNEFAAMLSAYPDFSLQYHIVDGAKPVLGKDDYLMPVHITRDSLIYELNEAVVIHGDRGFISYDDVYAFGDSFDRILEKLQLFMDSENREEAVKAGHEMIDILMEIQTDDDYFPISDIQYICEIIDPMGVDEELKAKVQNWMDNM